MKHIVEALTESAATLDHHLLGDRAIKFVSVTLAAEVALGLGAAYALQGHETIAKRASSVPIESSPDAGTQNQSDKRSILPQPLTKAKRFDAMPKPSPTSIRPINNIQRKDIVLPNAPAQKSTVGRLLLARSVSPPQFADISWPQCTEERAGNDRGVVTGAVSTEVATGFKGKPLMVVGVNGGRPLTSNNCLKQSAAITQNYDFYLNAANPGQAVMRQYLPASGYKCKPADNGCVAEAYGYLSANYSVQLIAKAGLHVPQNYFWLDVEHPNPWKGGGHENRLVIIGMIKALKAASPHSKVGIYSIPQSVKQPNLVNPWNEFMGIDHAEKSIDPWLSRFDTWIATGAGTAEQALAACSERASFTGGRNVLSQYTIKLAVKGYPTRNIDGNVVCPAPRR